MIEKLEQKDAKGALKAIIDKLPTGSSEKIALLLSIFTHSDWKYHWTDDTYVNHSDNSSMKLSQKEYEALLSLLEKETFVQFGRHKLGLTGFWANVQPSDSRTLKGMWHKTGHGETIGEALSEAVDLVINPMTRSMWCYADFEDPEQKTLF